MAVVALKPENKVDGIGLRSIVIGKRVGRTADDVVVTCLTDGLSVGTDVVEVVARYEATGQLGEAEAETRGVLDAHLVLPEVALLPRPSGCAAIADAHILIEEEALQRVVVENGGRRQAVEAVDDEHVRTLTVVEQRRDNLRRETLAAPVDGRHAERVEHAGLETQRERIAADVLAVVEVAGSGGRIDYEARRLSRRLLRVVNRLPRQAHLAPFAVDELHLQAVGRQRGNGTCLIVHAADVS